MTILHPRIFHHVGLCGFKKTQGLTYSYNGRVIGHGSWLVLLAGALLLDAKIFHIAAAEDDILVDLIRGGNLFFWIALATL